MSTAMSSAASQVLCRMSSIGETSTRHPEKSQIRQKSARPSKNIKSESPPTIALEALKPKTAAVQKMMSDLLEVQLRPKAGNSTDYDARQCPGAAPTISPSSNNVGLYRSTLKTLLAIRGCHAFWPDPVFCEGGRLGLRRHFIEPGCV